MGASKKAIGIHLFLLDYAPAQLDGTAGAIHCHTARLKINPFIEFSSQFCRSSLSLKKEQYLFSEKNFLSFPRNYEF
jgi:hypothetical protein